MQGSSRRMNKPAQRLACIIEQTLPDRHRIQSEGQPVDQRMPGVGASLFGRQQITLRQPLVAERPEPLQLPASYPLTRRGEIARDLHGADFLIEGNQLAGLIAAGMIIGSLDGRELHREQEAVFISVKKSDQTVETCNLGNPQRTSRGSQGHQPFCRAELLEQRVTIAEQGARRVRPFWFGLLHCLNFAWYAEAHLT